MILVERPVDKWMSSVGGVFIDNWLFGLRGLILCGIGPWVGTPGPNVLRDLLTGFLQAGTKQEAWKRLPIVHKEHYTMVKELVPREQVLEFSLDDGWEPLCQFLGVPVPEVPFPHRNNRDSIMERGKKRSDFVLFEAGKWLGLLLLVLGFVGLGVNSVR